MSPKELLVFEPKVDFQTQMQSAEY